MQEIGHEQLEDMMNNNPELVLINVLSSEKFRNGHIPGSINVPYESRKFIKIAEEMVPDKDADIVVYSDSENSAASPRAALQLESAGYNRIYEFTGGIKEWNKYNHHITTPREHKALLKARDIMRTDVLKVNRQTSVRKLACLMKEKNVGDLLVADGEVAVGIVTDRDIVLRCMAQKKDPDICLAAEVMSVDIISCQMDDTLERVASIMGEKRIRRLPVINNKNHLVGIISLGDLALVKEIKDKVADAFARVYLAPQ